MKNHVLPNKWHSSDNLTPDLAELNKFFFHFTENAYHFWMIVKSGLEAVPLFYLLSFLYHIEPISKSQPLIIMPDFKNIVIRLEGV